MFGAALVRNLPTLVSLNFFLLIISFVH